MKTSLSLITAALVSTSAAHAVTYDAWKSQVFTVSEAANPLVSGDLADPDKDGFNNLLEYAMNGHPKVASPTLMPTASKAAGGVVSLLYTRRREALDLDYIVEVSNDMVNWSSGFANVWTTNAVPNATVTAKGVALVTADQVTATSQLAASGKQFMRLKVIRSSRSGILTAITAAGNNPTTLTLNSVVPSGPYAGAITQYPVIAPHYPNYVAQWFFAARCLESFAETQPAVCKAFVEAYLRNLDVEGGTPTYRIHDHDLWSDHVGQVPPFWSLIQRCRSDSDDAYAAAVLLLAGKLKRLYPNDTWFDSGTISPGVTVREMLKHVAYANITSQSKDSELVAETASGPIFFNRAIRTFQNGNSNVADASCPDALGRLQITNYPVGFLMDNVHVWAGLNEFAIALEMVEPGSNDTIYYKGWRNQQAITIHEVFWDTANQAWRENDTTDLDVPTQKHVLKPAGAGPFYAALHCQLIPQLYGLPYPGSTAETQRRYNMAWKWVVDHMPNWAQSSAWPISDQFSHIEIAVVAAQMGETQNVSSFLNMARGRWLPGGTVTNGTVSEQIGYWQALVGH